MTIEPDNTAISIIIDAGFRGLYLDLKADKIIARPERALTSELRGRITANRAAIYAWLTNWIRDGCRLELKLLLTPLVNVDSQRLDAGLVGWKRRIDQGRAENERNAEAIIALALGV